MQNKWTRNGTTVLITELGQVKVEYKNGYCDWPLLYDGRLLWDRPELATQAARKMALKAYAELARREDGGAAKRLLELLLEQTTIPEDIWDLKLQDVSGGVRRLVKAWTKRKEGLVMPANWPELIAFVNSIRD